MIKKYLICLYVYLSIQFLIPTHDIMSRYIDFVNSNINIFSLVIGIFSNIMFIVIIILGIRYIILSIKLYKENNNIVLRENIKLMKFNLLPYWILNVFCVVFLLYAAGFFNYIFKDIYGKGMGIGILVVMIILPNLFFSYIILGISSCASIAYIKLLKKDNKIQKVGIHIFLQLFFVFDIVGIIILENILKKKSEILEARNNCVN